MPEMSLDKIQQARESIQRAVEQVEACFTQQDTVADQIERACDLMLEFTRQFGVEREHRRESISLKSSALDLRVRERKGELSREDFRTECAQIRNRVLDLTDVMRKAAEDELAQVGAEATARAGVKQPVAGAIRQRTNLRSSLEKFLRHESGDDIGFRCNGLGKRYGIEGPFIIQDLDMELRNGEIVGVVGLNGSGKTTLLRMVAGSLEKSEGECEYPSLKCKPDNWVTIRRSIAVVSQRPDRWTGTLEDALTLQAACFGDTGAEGAHLVDFFIARLGLTPYRHHTWGQLSGGYRTRFELAKAMLSRPRMLVLDEPLAALDIPTQMSFLTDLEDFATTFAEPMPVLISSQHIYEVEAVARHMIVIRDGKAIYNGPTSELGNDRKANGFEISCDLSVARLTEVLADCGVQSVQALGPRDTFVMTDREVPADRIIQALTRANTTVRHFRDASRSSRMYFE